VKTGDANKEIEQRKFVDDNATAETRWVTTGGEQNKELELPAWDDTMEGAQNVNSQVAISGANGGDSAIHGQLTSPEAFNAIIDMSYQYRTQSENPANWFGAAAANAQAANEADFAGGLSSLQSWQHQGADGFQQCYLCQLSCRSGKHQV
jgi:hypothetical protein